ncbi:MAG: DUF2207 domain-containing protein [Xanthomonadales bacterium]|nr:DUF2207 domain-containing protein [Xanthomonadales bacterium]
MRRFLQCLGLAALWLSPVSAPADERILEYRSDIEVQASGQILVTERIRVQAEGDQIRRGIFRDFPTRYRDRAGNTVNVEFTPLQVSRNGSPEPWHTRKMSNGVRIYVGSSERMLSHGIHDYELVFATNRQLGFFDDRDELYFNAVGQGWAFPIDKAVATVRLPFSVPSGQFSLSVYSGRFGSTEDNAVAEVLRGNQVRFETTRPLQPKEGLTLAVGWPKGLIAEPGPGQKIRWFFADNAAALVLLLGLLLPAGWYFWAWKKVGRDPRKGIIIPRFEPPQNLSPAACRYVNDMSFNRHAFTAAIISLAVKGQLIIEEDDKDFTLKRVSVARQSHLSSGEKAVLKFLLPGPSSQIEMDNENHASFTKARKGLKKALKTEYLGRLFNLNGKYFALPVLMTAAAVIAAIFFTGGPAVWVVFVVLSLLLHGLFGFLMRAPTPAGRRVMDEIEGFKRYLETAEQDRLERMRSPALTPEVFEAFLPYAYALGVENSWCKRFARELPEDARQQAGYHPGWYRGNFHGIHALNHLGDNFSSTFASAISSASTPPGSSSGSGGGGFSGGGGGGGGGGGW